MQRSSRVVLAAAAVSMCLGVGQLVTRAQGKTSPVTGVWKVTEVTTTGPNARKTTNPQPGMIIFTASHYATVRVTSDAPRAELPPPDQRTDKQMAEAFGPFVANAGTYEIKGNEITTKELVAKNPGAMKPGTFVIQTFRMEGKDTLWLTQKANANGPAQNPTTLKLTRIE